MKTQRKTRHGFTLVEMLVVLGVIVIIISMLMPSLTHAREKANQVVCESNMRQVGAQMLIYADQYNGFLFPPNMGWETAPSASNNFLPYGPYQDPLQTQYQELVWPYPLFGSWNPQIMLCPSDLEPYAQHSYILNNHMAYWNVKYGVTPQGVSPSDIVLMGEKVSNVGDYYMEYTDFATKVEEHRHGLAFGSNYLKLDMHVDTELPQEAYDSLDPWDFANGIIPTTLPSAP